MESTGAESSSNAYHVQMSAQNDGMVPEESTADEIQPNSHQSCNSIALAPPTTSLMSDPPACPLVNPQPPENTAARLLDNEAGLTMDNSTLCNPNVNGLISNSRPDVNLAIETASPESAVEMATRGKNEQSTTDSLDDTAPITRFLLENAASSANPRLEISRNEEASTSKPNVFTVDTSLIPSVPGELQATELQGLEGVSVFDQEEFERGVLEQVDQAISIRQQAVDRERAERELNTVLTDIRSCKKELRNLDRLMSLANTTSSNAPLTFAQKELQRNLLSVRTKRENKAKQLKTLRARQRCLLAKLSGSDVGLQASDDEEDDQDKNVQTYQNLLCGSPPSEGIPTQPQQETEQERLIRLGEMTPFGSMVQASTIQLSTFLPKPAPKPVVTDFEKFMVQKTADDMTRLKKVASRKKTPVKFNTEQAPSKSGSGASKISSTSTTSKFEQKSCERLKSKKKTSKQNKRTKDSSQEEAYFVYKPVRGESSSFPKARKRRKKALKDLRPHWGSDSELSDYGDEGNSGESDEDYKPGINDFSQSSDDDDNDVELLHKKTKRRGRKAKVSKEDIEGGTIANLDDLKRANSVNVKRCSSYSKFKCKDDATQDLYCRRLKEHRRSELRKKQVRIEQGEVDSDSDVEDMRFDGGLTIPCKIWSKLFGYQKVGVKWLWELHQQQAGGIVGDEMGLGKTIQMIAFLAGLKASKVRNPGFRYLGLGPVLIVCPATVLHQWVKEFYKWWPEMRVAILHDSGSHTGSKRALICDIALSHAILVTSYSGLRIQERLLLQHDWHYIILDEGHKIRNPDAAITQSCKQFRTCHRLILSGSPMQNNLRELWSLIDFVFPGKLGTLPVFMEKFSVPITIGGYSNATEVQVQTAYKCATVLRDTINPYLLRRLKADLKQYLKLPNKNEQVLFCRLTEQQIELYKDYLNSKECQLILNREYQIFAGLITLRKICNHPDLVSGGPKIIRGDHSAEALEAARDPTNQFGYWERSGKMIVVSSLLKLWQKQGHRVLLFSQSKQMLNIMEAFVKHTYTYMRMDGSTSISSRQPLIQQFNDDPSIFVFLLTTRVGGLGVNLTGANRVIIFDPDWNPSTDTQARERAWRIGQNRQVTIYRLITNGSIEEKIYHRQIFKQFLTNRVLKDPRQRRFFKSNDLFELFTLGSDNSKQGTETSAIFAGVGSDVKVKMLRSSPSRKKLNNKRDSEVVKKRSLKSPEVDTTKNEGCSQPLQNGHSENPGPSTEGREAQQSNGKLEGTSSSAKRSLPPSMLAVQNGDVLKAGKQKKRKKKKDAKLDGHRIANLAKHSAYRPKATESQDKPEQTDAQQDDYVLSKLLKKSGVHSALQHDNIMQSGNPDYILVEGEAERVAKEAVHALRESRRHCHRASSGVPTWTGSRNQAGGTPPAKKPRFGQKSNDKITGVLGESKIRKDKDEQRRKTSASPVSKPKHFSGTNLIETAASKPSTSKTPSLPSSQSLLAQMRKRNSDGSQPSTGTAVEDSQSDLLSDIRDFVAFQASASGQATTAEILEKFRGKLPADNSALFKSMLKQICMFHRVDGAGVWKLKQDFQ